MSFVHFSHKHPLVFIQKQSHTSEKADCSGSNEPVDQEQCHASEEACFYCSGCKDQVEGPSYCCTDCKFYLHKTCAEQAQEINHPFHREHPLTLLAESPYPLPTICICNFCRNPCNGFVYHCSSCKFDLHIKCFLLQQFIVGNFSEIQHFGHKHPLIFIEKHNNEVKNPCSACEEPLLGSIYGCFDCGFYLHEACVKFPEKINDPFHRKHPLKLLAKSPYPPSGICYCNFCRSHCRGFIYHCRSCQFDLHVKCALHPQFSGGNSPEFKHFSHKHPLIFIEKHKKEVQDSCYLCEESLSGPIYSCFDCGFHLDKKCFELPREINHPFHRRHPLVILDKPPNPSKDTCNFCRSRFWGFHYHCSSCGFNLHIRCALLAQLNPGNVVEIKHFSHEAHPLIFIEELSVEVHNSCHGCREPLSGPVYSCLDCMFHLHKSCAELPVKINHPSHRKHPLVLWANLPTHQEGCSCYLCKKQMQSKGFVYYCSDCKFGSMPEDISLLRMATPEKLKHEHPFTLVSRPISFICDFCGVDGYGTPYLCPTCDLVVEKYCFQFPSTIRIIRHPHEIPHRYFLQESNKIEKRECSICRKNVNTEHGSYYCGDCNYIVHVRCATDGFIWDPKAELHDEDLMSKRSSIIRVIEEIKDGEDLIASKIQHYFHRHKSHNLSLTRALNDGLNQDDKSCDGCMQPISAPFYSCGTCDFFLHKNCAELPMEKRHPLHRHPLTLYKPHSANQISNCKACLCFHHGLTYRCNTCDFYVDIRCSLLSDTFKHESHEHQLFLDHKYEGNCSACLTQIEFQRGAFRCRDCEFVLDFKCITLPQKACPECPVCLQPYDGACTIPRVLACGHTVCESCLASLPQKLPGAIRCPACTVLVKYPPEGPTALPKNIDLLRLIPDSENPRKPVNKSPNDSRVPFLPRSWSDEFYSNWKKYLLPDDAVEKQKVSLLTVGSFSSGGEDGSGFKAGCLVRVMDCLSEMKEEEREELGLVLRAFTKQSGRICRFLGLWGDLGDGILYLVSEKQKSGNFLDKNLGAFEKDGVFNFAMIGMEMCEAVIALYKEGLIAGCLGYSCFHFDDFGHVYLDLNEVLLIGRRIHDIVVKVGSNGKKIGDGEISVLLKDFLKRDVFISPEVLLALLEKEGIGVECGSSRYSIGYSSDVWLLGCILLRILVGEVFSDVLVDYMCHIVVKASEDSESACSSVYTSLMEKTRSLLGTKFGSEHESLQQILCKCLDFDPENRALVRDVWKFIRELVIKPQFDKIVKLGRASYDENRGRCLVVGKLCLLSREKTETHEKDESQGNETNGAADMVNGLTEGSIKSKDLQGHLDCVTGLAVARGYLFSSSFDKSVKVWSLQEYSHLHTFTGHEHKVMAVVCVDEEQPLCISGDSGGGICVWSINIPFKEEPLKKWYEEKDWRYSGIHALAVSEKGYLYTGSGDKLIKEWSMRDGTLSCTMSGHKSVVSTLAVSNGVLYSGSWDGTVRLWSLSDHSLLTVLGGNTLGTVTPVFSLAADQNTLVATYENGSVKIWRDDVFRKSIQIHNGAIFAISLEGKWLFTGSWDRTIKAQELAGDDFPVDVRAIGSIPCDSVITALSYWEGKLFVGFGDRTVKVYYHEK